METRIEVKGLSKAYGFRKLFTNLSFEIPDHSVFAVLGHNGSGKTTMLRIICGLIPATAGQVNIIRNGKALTRDECRAVLGLVAPELDLYGELTALENLEFFSRVRGLPYEPKKCRELLTSLGLKGRGHDPVSTFSSGMKQRMKYACALLHDPHVLVLDEPTSNLDEEGLSLVDGIIRAQRQKGIVVMATNEPREVSYADQTLRLA